MALIDKALMLAENQAISATGIVGSAINFAQSDIGSGKRLKIVCVATATGTGSTASNSFIYTVRTADSAAGLSTGTILYASQTIAGDAHVAGTLVFEHTLPASGIMKSRLAVYATETGTATATVSIFVVGEDWQWGEGQRLPITAASA
jgi:hypothetical protein